MTPRDDKHTCHARGCFKCVPPNLWGCREHWYALPKSYRDAIWETYVPGQEIRKDPSPEYIEAATAAVNWLAAKENV